MEDIGLKPFLAAKDQAPIIVTFHAPPSPHYDFQAMYQAVRSQGFILYPGKLTQVETFRVGCIGAIDAQTSEKPLRPLAMPCEPWEWRLDPFPHAQQRHAGA